MYILGINAYHADTSATLIKDGQLVAAVEEERFRRVKHWAGFPSLSIQYCLKKAGISLHDLDHIAVSRDPRAHLPAKILYMLSHRPSLALIQDRLANMRKINSIRQMVLQALEADQSELRAEFHNVEHHKAHIASAFLVSGFEEAAILSVDGFGDFVSTMLAKGSGPSFRVLKTVLFPHSLGHFYTSVTQYLGFPKYGDEGKVMGLAPYGKPIYLDEMRQMVRSNGNGSFGLDLSYFSFHTDGVEIWEGGVPHMPIGYSDKFIARFGEPRQPRSELSDHYKDIAASLQAALEEALFDLLDWLYRQTGQKNLCMAGGVALNSAFNGKILPNTPFQELFIQPAAGDAGTSLGAAYYVYHTILGYPRCFTMTHAYTGPEFSDEEIAAALNRYNLEYETCSSEKETARRGAEIVSKGNVLGWFQGAMEFGPRALGNRSIIADPRRSDMKNILNSRIKHRENFRPFAPSILIEAVEEYFEQTYPDPFMLKVYKVKEDKRSTIPAVVHVDGTGRLQTVSRQENPRYWQLIKSFEDLTGVPVVLNTSFNENEPIVCQPEEAIECYLRTKMDTLILGNFVLQKESEDTN